MMPQPMVVPDAGWRTGAAKGTRAAGAITRCHPPRVVGERARGVRLRHIAVSEALLRTIESLAALDRLVAATGDQLVRVLNYRNAVRMPALGFVQLALNHMIHHRGQLSVYLREVGVRVPPIYG